MTAQIVRRVAAFCFLLLTSLPFALSQEFYSSMHAFEMERHKNTPVSPDLVGDRDARILPLQPRLAKAARLDATVFGFLPYWSTSEFLNFDLLTHVAAFAVEVNANGTLGNDHGWPWNNLINEAHAKGVKVILTATLFDPTDINTLITSEQNKQRFFENIKNKMLEGTADGINIDFEGSNSSGWHWRINGFMAELTEYMHREVPGSEVSFDAPAVNWGDTWDYLGLAQSCDYLFIMGYAFHGSWSSTSGPNAPLIGGAVNISNTVNVQFSQVTQNMPEKLILGVPYYGHHWKTTSSGARSSVTDFIGARFFDSAMSGALTYGQQWETASQTPWYRWDDGSHWNQVWFDNDSSLAMKYNLAKIKGYKGVGMWALGYDGNRQELWSLLDQEFGSGEIPVPDTPLSFRVLNENENALRIQFEPARRASGYFVYLSDNGLEFEDSVFVASNNAVLHNLEPEKLYFLRLRAVNSTGLSQQTETLAGVPSANSHRLLIVHGFDRTTGTNNRFDYIRQHAHAIQNRGFAFSSASNEAVSRGRLALTDFTMIDWILGDESTADETFNPIEQDSVEAFLQNGGKLFVSGAEIGWDLQARGSASDAAFYHNFLKANYIADAPNNNRGLYYTAEPVADELFDGLEDFDFDDGSQGTFDVDWPDAIQGAQGGVVCLKYLDVGIASGGAGVSFNGIFPNGKAPGKLVHLSVPFETIYPESARNDVMARVLDFFEDATTGVDDKTPSLPTVFALHQNFPNPFNPNTTIAFDLPAAGRATLEIFDILGKLVRTFENNYERAGAYEVDWDSRDSKGRLLASGAYLYRLVLTSSTGQRFVESRKMILVE